MKKLLLMLCFIAGITTLSKAQGGGRHRMSPADQAKSMQTQLKLSDDKTAKITSIMQVQNTKMDSVRTASNGDRDAMRTAMAPIRKEMATQIKAVLTADQATAYHKMQADRMSRMQNGSGNPPSPQK